MNLHLFSEDSNNKFSKSYINFINTNFNAQDHLFIIIQKDEKTRKEKNVVVLSRTLTSLILLIGYIIRAKKVILHGLDSYMVITMTIYPIALSKTYWVIWGGDLYYYLEEKDTYKKRIFEKMRKFVVRNIYGLITHLKGDYELAKDWYHVKGHYLYSFMYPSNLYKEYDLKKVEKHLGKTYIQVGNSACETNEHIEVFEKLSKYKDENINILCPLSYSGNEEYIKQVIEAGYKTFGKEKFSPITEFMPFDEYLELLAKIDIAIFNHKRQRGLGNITTLLGLGKKVYIHEDITTWQFCVDHDLKVYSANGNYDDLFEEMDEEIKQNNAKNMKTKFSEKKLVKDWRRIFDA